MKSLENFIANKIVYLFIYLLSYKDWLIEFTTTKKSGIICNLLTTITITIAITTTTITTWKTNFNLSNLIWKWYRQLSNWDFLSIYKISQATRIFFLDDLIFTHPAHHRNFTTTKNIRGSLFPKISFSSNKETIFSQFI